MIQIHVWKDLDIGSLSEAERIEQLKYLKSQYKEVRQEVTKIGDQIAMRQNKIIKIKAKSMPRLYDLQRKEERLLKAQKWLLHLIVRASNTRGD